MKYPKSLPKWVVDKIEDLERKLAKSERMCEYYERRVQNLRQALADLHNDINGALNTGKKNVL